MRLRQASRSKKSASFCLLLMCFIMLCGAQQAFAATSVDIILDVHQLFTGRTDLAPSDTFTYQLKAKESGNPMPLGSAGDTYEFALGGTSDLSIGRITFTRSGTYKYEMYQHVDIRRSGYSYDNQTFTITVYVDSALKANLVIEKKAGVKTDALRFENSYKKPGSSGGGSGGSSAMPSDPSLMVDPPVKKTVSGTPPEKSTFLFTLTAASPSYPMPSGSINGVKTMEIVGSGEEDFGTWSYKREGVYYYKIAEVNTNESGYAYDTEVYTITDTVTAVAGQLTVSRVVSNSANKRVQSCLFVNVYGGRLPGITSPNTGDDITGTPYIIVSAISALVALLCVCWLVFLHKREGEDNADTQ